MTKNDSTVSIFSELTPQKKPILLKKAGRTWGKYYCHIKYDGSQFRYMRSALCLVFIVVFPLFLVGSVKLLERMISALCLVMFPCLFLVGSAGL